MARNVIGKWPRKTVISKLKFSLDTNDIINCIKLSTKRETKKQTRHEDQKYIHTMTCR